MSPLETFALLVFCHCLADFPLQGDYLAAAKCHRVGVPGTPWPIALAAHSIIHGGFAGIVTGSVLGGVLETFAHARIDWLKSEGRISYTTDQLLHLACKAFLCLPLLWETP